MAPTRKKRPSWIWSVLPENSGTGGFGTLLPVIVNQLGGTVVNFAVMSTLYNITVTLAQFFWGAVTDRLQRRRLFFVIAFVGTAVIFVTMYLIPDLTWLTIAYGLLGVVIVANGTSASLLVMETSEKKVWVSTYSMLGLVSSVGAGVGLLAGVFWASFLPPNGFIIFCAACATVSVLLTFLLVSEPPIPLETAQLGFQLSTLLSRILHGTLERIQPSVFVSLTLQTPKRILKLLRSPGDQGRKSLFVSGLVFMTANSLQGTPFTPFLLAYHVGDNEVFAVSLSSLVLQVFAYRWVTPLVKRFGVGRVGAVSIVSRVLLFAAVSLFALFFAGFNLFVLSLAWNALSGATWAVYNSAVNVILFSSMGPTGKGGVLGGYGAVTNFGTVIGAFLSGYISFYIGYTTTFAASAVLMLISYLILRSSL